MTRKICTTFSIVYFLLTLTLFGGNAQFSEPNVTETRASLISPGIVQFTCTAPDRDILSVSWHDPHGNLLNSTFVSRHNESSGPSLIATLEVERENCLSVQYTCVFQSELATFQAQVACPPSPVVQFEASEYSVGEGDGTLRVCVEVYNMSSGGVVTITEVDHTASRQTDFTLPSTFDLNVTAEQLLAVTTDAACASNTLCGVLCFSIPITQDNVFEYDQESFSLETRVRGMSGGVSSSETTIYIQDDDVLVIGFDRATLTVNEGDHECSPNVRVCAKISDVTLGLPLMMSPVWRAGTATEGLDYHPPPCNFTFPAGGFMDCVDLSVVNDSVMELTETLSVAVGQVLVDGQGVELGDRVRVGVSEAIIQIIDNDVFELSFEDSEYTIQEGGPGETHIALRACLVQREGGAQSVELGGGRDSLSVSVSLYTHNGTATVEDDFEAVNRILSVTLPLSSPSVELCECVRVFRDHVVETTEYFDLRLYSPTPSVHTTGSRVLLRDNSQLEVTVGFERSEYTVTEEMGNLEVCVLLNGCYQRSIHVYVCTEPDTATENEDYVGVKAHQLTFVADPFSQPISDGRACLNISVMEDMLLEGEERFLITLQSTDSAVQFTRHTAFVTLENNGGTLPSLTYIDDTPFVRGNEVRASFNITNRQDVSSLSCELAGPGRTITMTQNCTSGHVTFSNVPFRRQVFTLIVTAFLPSRPLQPHILSSVDFRLDHDVCWLHPINQGVVRDGSRVEFEWQATGPHPFFRVQLFLCRRDREGRAVPCSSPYVWEDVSPGPHTLFVTPVHTPGCRRRLTRVFDFISTD